MGTCYPLAKGSGPAMKVFQPFRLDTVNHCLWRAEERVRLTPRGFWTYSVISWNTRNVSSRRMRSLSLWPETYVNPEVIKQYIRGIRKALGDDPEKPSYIETFPDEDTSFIRSCERRECGLFPSSGSKGIVGRKTALAELDVCLARLCGASDKPFLSPERQASARLRSLTYSSSRPLVVRIFG